MVITDFLGLMSYKQQDVYLLFQYRAFLLHIRLTLKI